MFACSLTALLCFFLSQSCHLWFFSFFAFSCYMKITSTLSGAFLTVVSRSHFLLSFLRISLSPPLSLYLYADFFSTVFDSQLWWHSDLWSAFFETWGGIILHVCVCESISILWNTCGCLCMCDTQRVCFLSHQSPCCSVSWTSSFSLCALLNHCAWALMKFTISFSISCLPAGAVGFHEIFRLEISIGLGKSFNSTLICQIASRGRQVVDF